MWIWFNIYQYDGTYYEQLYDCMHSNECRWKWKERRWKNEHVLCLTRFPSDWSLLQRLLQSSHD